MEAPDDSRRRAGGTTKGEEASGVEKKEGQGRWAEPEARMVPPGAFGGSGC